MSNYCVECRPLAIRQKKEITETLEKMVKDWEEGLGPDDKSLYSLGLRRALDIINTTMEEDDVIRPDKENHE
jgi:hypothetical protein